MPSGSSGPPPFYNVVFLGLVTDISQDYSCNTATTHTILIWLGTLGGGSSGKQGSSKQERFVAA